MLDVSFTFGTYNRLSHLRQTIESCRVQADGMSYEIVVVGVTDDIETLDYLRAQSDVVLIEHGELLGANRAHHDAAEAAQGEFCVLCNDDVAWEQTGIIRACVLYLRENQNVGAVAFGQDIPNQAANYMAMMECRTPSDRRFIGPVLEMGIVRKVDGDDAGWLGATSGPMAGARSYWGDVFLPGRLWEAGRRIDHLPIARILHYKVEDALRQQNNDTWQKDSECFRQVFPNNYVNVPEWLFDQQQVNSEQWTAHRSYP